MAKLVDALALGASFERSAGSIPVKGTTYAVVAKLGRRASLRGWFPVKEVQVRLLSTAQMEYDEKVDVLSAKGKHGKDRSTRLTAEKSVI